MIGILLVSFLLFFLLAGWQMNKVNTLNRSEHLANHAENDTSPSPSVSILIDSSMMGSIIVFITILGYLFYINTTNINFLWLWLPTTLITLVVVFGSLFILRALLKLKFSKQRFIPRRQAEEHKSSTHSIDNNEALEVLYQDDDEENDPVELFENALALFDIEISECLIPRKEIVGVDIADSIEKIKQTFIDSKHSKLIVYENDMDSIVGYLHHSDFYHNPTSIKNLIREIPTVPQNMTALELLSYFKRKQKSIAWVVDEFGGTEGILTTEDLLEELFGEIEDEHDQSEYIEQQISANEFILSGRLEVEYINDKFDLELSTESAETLSGYIIEAHNEIPKKNEIILIDQYEFKILKVSKTRIETTKLKVLMQ